MSPGQHTFSHKRDLTWHIPKCPWWAISIVFFRNDWGGTTQPAIICSKLTIETLEQRCEICSKLTIKPPKRHHWRRFGSFIVNFEHISHLCPSFSVVNFEQVITGWAFYFHILVLDYVLLIRFVFVYNFVLHHSPICWTSKLRLLNSRCYLISCVLSASDIVLGIAWEIIKLQYPLVTFL